VRARVRSALPGRSSLTHRSSLRASSRVTRPILLGGAVLVALSASGAGLVPSGDSRGAAEPAPFGASTASAAADAVLTQRGSGTTSRSQDREPLAAEAARAAAAAEAQRQADAAAEAQRQAEAAAVQARVQHDAEVAAAQADPRGVARAMLADHGWGADQFRCLDSLWTKESGWKATADNRSSSAYGIPQALPGSKMASAGEDWRTNPRTQIAWGLGYIASSYGTPCGAWAHSRSYNWY
jgi:hypothetical protein